MLSDHQRLELLVAKRKLSRILPAKHFNSSRWRTGILNPEKPVVRLRTSATRAMDAMRSRHIDRDIKAMVAATH